MPLPMPTNLMSTGAHTSSEWNNYERYKRGLHERHKLTEIMYLHLQDISSTYKSCAHVYVQVTWHAPLAADAGIYIYIFILSALVVLLISAPRIELLSFIARLTLLYRR